MSKIPADRWSSGSSYEAYVGRWSRRVAVRFLDWLEAPDGARWLDVGSGTGALTETILATRDPASVVGVDRSEPFVEHAREHVTDDRASFRVASADATGLDDASVDVVVSGLVLNFVPDIPAALAELQRVVVPGGLVAGYVWDYGEGMEFMRRFWDAAIAVDSSIATLDEATRFPITAPGALAQAFRDAGLDPVEDRPIEIPTVFGDFGELWSPFLGGTGTAPAYLAGLDDATRDAVRDRFRASITEEDDGSIHLVARAWAAKGRRATASEG
jgi:SAM-dependent methyltransferase